MVADGRLAPDAKVMIRCASEDSVVEMHNALAELLRGRPEGLLAVHHRFGRGVSTMRPDVPRDLRARAERFLVHQFMLTEGIDDPKCAMLAIYEPFSTGRQLVQQIGRVIRHPDPLRSAAAPAFVIVCEGARVAHMWERYRAFDRMCIGNGGKPPLRNGVGVSRRLVRALPPMDYVHGRFRQRVNLDTPEIKADLRFPKSCIVFRVARNFDLDAFQGQISAALEDADRDVLNVGTTRGGMCRFHLSIALAPSPFLEEKLFLQPTLEVTIYVRHGEWLFFYDSGGLWIDELPGVEERVSPHIIRCLLPEGADTLVTMLAVKNSDIGPSSLRGRTLTAPSFAVAVPFMGEHMNIVTRADGRVGRTRRYVGFLRARLREGQRTMCPAEEYAAWTRDIARDMATARTSVSLFDRFARPSDVPNDPSAVNILMDLDDLAQAFVEHDGDDGLSINDACVNIVRADDPGRDEEPIALLKTFNEGALEDLPMAFIGRANNAGHARIPRPADWIEAEARLRKIENCSVYDRFDGFDIFPHSTLSRRLLPLVYSELVDK